MPAKSTAKTQVHSSRDPNRIPVTALKGVGPQLAAKLARIDIRTVQDVLFHLPFRYQDRTRVTPIGAARAGDEIVVVGQIEHAGISYGRRRSLLCTISDGSGLLTVRLFHFSSAQQARLKRGLWLRCFGEVRRGPAKLEMVHPEYELSERKPQTAGIEGLTPVYPSTEGVGQGMWRRITTQALQQHLRGVTELLPDRLLKPWRFPSLQAALWHVHRPPADTDVEQLRAVTDPSQQRLALEELLAHHLSLRFARRKRRTHSAPAMREDNGLLQAYWEALPFRPTPDQRRACSQILSDLGEATPMLRLLQGDVGSGKTVVAGAAVVRALENRYQVAVMAPTELLAEQHYRTLSAWLHPLGQNVAWLSGRVVGRERNELLGALQAGDVRLVVGTHALFQRGVEFPRLGLVVVDEQHRFGVDQRLALRDKGSVDMQIPHQLIMTATPIPRTLAMSFYADLDVSSIEHLPPGRKAVETVVVRESRRAEVVARVEAACREGRQAYWVCPIIDESEVLEAQAATDTEAALRASLPGLRIGLVHGRMRPREKEKVMERFRNTGLDLLVATTVIEVGVDVPNASLMVIENAERLGLAQLHQLRGRIGRGSDQACCVLMYRSPLASQARTRLALMRETTDGFEIARKDLELRGPGEVLGRRQTGLMQLMIADLVRDRELLPAVEKIARALIDEYPDQAQALVSRWVAEDPDYASV